MPRQALAAVAAAASLIARRGPRPLGPPAALATSRVEAMRARARERRERREERAAAKGAAKAAAA